MSSFSIASTVFVLVFGSALLGLFLGKILPDRHLDNDSREIVKLSTGLIATLTALVLGLLISSAKNTFDQVNNELIQISVKVVLLDRLLAQYGPETQEIRMTLKSHFAAAMEKVLSADEAQQTQLAGPSGATTLDGIQAKIRSLSPKNDEQHALKASALEITGEMASSRWLLALQRKGSISTPLLVVMVLWLSMIFAAWGVFSPRNLVVASALLASSLAVSGATFLMLELDEPLTGSIRITAGPIREALSHLAQ